MKVEGQKNILLGLEKGQRVAVKVLEKGSVLKVECIKNTWWNRLKKRLQGYSVGKNALDTLKKNASDISLSRQDEITLLKNIRARGTQVRVWNPVIASESSR